MQQTEPIDISLESLHHPKTAAASIAAMEAFNDATADLANEATSFFDTWGIDLYLTFPKAREDLDELQRLIRSRKEKQEAFLRALGSVPDSTRESDGAKQQR